MRFFIGTFLDDRNQTYYDKLVSEMVREHRSALRGVPERSTHVTYLFAANAPDEAAAAIAQAVEETASRHHPIELDLGAPHVLPSNGRPRLVCAAVVVGGEPLGRLVADVGATLRRACPELPFELTKSLHVTLARFRRPARRQEAVAVRTWLEANAKPRRDLRVEQIQLIQSDLGGPVPLYTVLRDAPIR